jgi:hypothetical protein
MAKNQISNSVRKKADKIMEQSEEKEIRDGQLPATRVPMRVERHFRKKAEKARRTVTEIQYFMFMNTYYSETGQREKIIVW